MVDPILVLRRDFKPENWPFIFVIFPVSESGQNLTVLNRLTDLQQKCSQNFSNYRNSLVDLQHVEGEGEEGAEEAGPGCEVEELTSAGQSPPAGGHGDSSTEIQDLEHEMMFLGF